MWSTLAVPLLAAGCVLSVSIQEPLLAAGDPPNIPPFPFPRPKPVTHTVYDLIHHNDKYTKLNKAIKFVGDDFISVLNNTSQEITFFAVPDSALRPHDDDDDDDHKHKHKHHHHHHGKHNALLELALGSTLDDTALLGQPTGLAEAIELIELIESVPRGLDGDEDPGHERRKEIFRQIVKAILNYHVLPSGGFNLASLAHNTTWATNFMIPKLSGGRGQRVLITEHVEEVEADKKKKKKKKNKHTEDVVTRINLYAKIDEADTKTENGYVHVVNHPLLPPPAVFQEVFLVQHYFSTFTSALQRVGLADELDIRYVKGEGDEHGHLEGNTAVTVFAPTNAAFDRLPIKLKLFLFSNFGRRVLRKLLEYHIVPNVVAHADYIFQQKADTDSYTPMKHDLWSYLGLLSDEPISSVNESFNTRLFNHTIDFSAEKSESKHKHRKEFKNKVLVNGRPVVMADLVAVNGAFHVIDHLLCPCKKHKHDLAGDEANANEWDDWENCVSQLAESGELK